MPISLLSTSAAPIGDEANIRPKHSKMGREEFEKRGKLE
jgi:hypothetical protein